MESTIKLKYDGPADQAHPAVGQATGEGDLLEPGREYDLPEDVALGLVTSTAGWTFVGDPPRSAGIAAMSAAKARDHAAELGTPAAIAAARALEHARGDGARTTILDALDARQAELEGAPAPAAPAAGPEPAEETTTAGGAGEPEEETL